MIEVHNLIHGPIDDAYHLAPTGENFSDEEMAQDWEDAHGQQKVTQAEVEAVLSKPIHWPSGKRLRISVSKDGAYRVLVG